MRKSYVKPVSNCYNLQTASFIAGSSYTTTDTAVAVNIIEACFRVKQGNSDDINDTQLENWLNSTGKSFIAKADNQGGTDATASASALAILQRMHVMKLH